MATILISDTTYTEQKFQDTFGESLQELQAFGKNGNMWSYDFYTLGKTSSEEERIINSLSCGSHRNLYNICHILGEDTAIGVSKTTLMLRDSLIAASGASVGLFTARTNKFVLAAGEYQTALEDLRHEIKVNKGPGGDNTPAAQKIKTTYEEMNKNFGDELNLANRGRNAKSRSRSPLNNVQRAMNIVRSSRNIKKLNLTRNIEASALGEFSKKAKIIGPGIIVLDLGVRAYDVNEVYEQGGDWERAAFVESFGFVGSAIAGTLTIKAGVAIFLAMTPVGWVALIVAAAGASLYANDKGKEFGDSIYDDVKKFMDSK